MEAGKEKEKKQQSWWGAGGTPPPGVGGSGVIGAARGEGDGAGAARGWRTRGLEGRGDRGDGGGGWVWRSRVRNETILSSRGREAGGEGWGSSSAPSVD